MPTYINKCIMFIKFAEFSVLLPCSGNNSGIAQLGIGLMIESRKGKPLNGTPLRLNLRKECAVRGECVNRAHDHLFLYAHTHTRLSARTEFCISNNSLLNLLHTSIRNYRNLNCFINMKTALCKKIRKDDDRSKHFL